MTFYEENVALTRRRLFWGSAAFDPGHGSATTAPTPAVIYRTDPGQYDALAISR